MSATNRGRSARHTALAGVRRSGVEDAKPRHPPTFFGGASSPSNVAKCWRRLWSMD